MSNEYKDWIMDRASGVADTMREFSKIIPHILSYEAENKDNPVQIYNQLALIHQNVCNYFTEYGDVISRFANHEFLTSDIDYVDELELFIAQNYSTLKSISEMTTNIPEKESIQHLLTQILSWYDENDMEELLLENS